MEGAVGGCGGRTGGLPREGLIWGWERGSMMGGGREGRPQGKTEALEGVACRGCREA